MPKFYSEGGRKSVPSYYKAQSACNAKCLEDLYLEETHFFDVEKQKEKEARVVIWCDAQSILDKVMEERSITQGVTVKALADGGQGFLKICLTILPDDYEDQEQFGRARYSEGGTTAKRAKLTGVNRLVTNDQGDMSHIHTFKF